jgi:hypothetical protein
VGEEAEARAGKGFDAKGAKGSAKVAEESVGGLL